MSSITIAKQMVDLRRQQLLEAQEDLTRAYAESFVTCTHCKQKTKVRSITVIQTHWYVQPYSCNGGDYWNAGERQYNCPKCGQRNRDFNNEQFAEVCRERLDAFAGRVDEYDK